MQLLDGKKTAESVTARLREKVAALQATHGLRPGLAVVLVGNNPASEVYVRNKVRTAAELGLHSVRHDLPKDATQAQVLALVAQLNADPAIHGILVQSPPPPQIDERAITEALNPAKDVDCFHPYNVGKLTIGDEDGFLPCTPHGVLVLLEQYGIETRGRHAVVIGRSEIVGKPIALLLARKAKVGDCTVTLCHSRTRDLGAITRQADILIAAIGRAELVTADMVKDGAVVVDVGINRVEAPGSKKGYKLVGDVAFDAVSARAAWITPVPGGVGPMTIAMLMNNAIKACCRQHGVSAEGLW